jgi:hypothetical protein
MHVVVCCPEYIGAFFFICEAEHGLQIFKISLEGLPSNYKIKIAS